MLVIRFRRKCNSFILALLDKTLTPQVKHISNASCDLYLHCKITLNTYCYRGRNENLLFEHVKRIINPLPRYVSLSKSSCRNAPTIHVFFKSLTPIISPCDPYNVVFCSTANYRLLGHSLWLPLTFQSSSVAKLVQPKGICF